MHLSAVGVSGIFIFNMGTEVVRERDKVIAEEGNWLGIGMLFLHSDTGNYLILNIRNTTSQTQSIYLLRAKM